MSRPDLSPSGALAGLALRDLRDGSGENRNANRYHVSEDLKASIDAEAEAIRPPASEGRVARQLVHSNSSNDVSGEEQLLKKSTWGMQDEQRHKTALHSWDSMGDGGISQSNYRSSTPTVGVNQGGILRVPPSHLVMAASGAAFDKDSLKACARFWERAKKLDPVLWGALREMQGSAARGDARSGAGMGVDIAAIAREIRAALEGIIFTDMAHAVEVKGADQRVWLMDHKLSREAAKGLKGAYDRSVTQQLLVCEADAARFYRRMLQRLEKEHQAALAAPSAGAGGAQPARSLCQWCLLCMGDLARYQVARRGGGRSSAEARRCYLRALRLDPTHGKPHNQLAVLASYQGDDFESVYRYFRAMMTAHPFPARENLLVLFEKNREKLVAMLANRRWQRGEGAGRGVASSSRGRGTARPGSAGREHADRAVGDPPEDSGDEAMLLFKRRFLAVHGMLFTGVGLEELEGTACGCLQDMRLLLETILDVVEAEAWQALEQGGAEGAGGDAGPGDRWEGEQEPRRQGRGQDGHAALQDGRGAMSTAQAPGAAGSGGESGLFGDSLAADAGGRPEGAPLLAPATSPASRHAEAFALQLLALCLFTTHYSLRATSRGAAAQGQEGALDAAVVELCVPRGPWPPVVTASLALLMEVMGCVVRAVRVHLPTPPQRVGSGTMGQASGGSDGAVDATASLKITASSSVTVGSGGASSSGGDGGGEGVEIDVTDDGGDVLVGPLRSPAIGQRQGGEAGITSHGDSQQLPAGEQAAETEQGGGGQGGVEGVQAGEVVCDAGVGTSAGGGARQYKGVTVATPWLGAVSLFVAWMHRFYDQCMAMDDEDTKRQLAIGLCSLLNDLQMLAAADVLPAVDPASLDLPLPEEVEMAGFLPMTLALDRRAPHPAAEASTPLDAARTEAIRVHRILSFGHFAASTPVPSPYGTTPGPGEDSENRFLYFHPEVGLFSASPTPPASPVDAAEALLDSEDLASGTPADADASDAVDGELPAGSNAGIGPGPGAGGSGTGGLLVVDPAVIRQAMQKVRQDRRRVMGATRGAAGGRYGGRGGLPSGRGPSPRAVMLDADDRNDYNRNLPYTMGEASSGTTRSEPNPFGGGNGRTAASVGPRSARQQRGMHALSSEQAGLGGASDASDGDVVGVSSGWSAMPALALSSLGMGVAGHAGPGAPPPRLIIVDAPNVAMRHGLKKKFSCRGIQIAIEFWRSRGIQALGFLPDYYLDYDAVGGWKSAARLGMAVKQARIPDSIALLRQMVDEGVLILTPPQDYDDSYCISYARAHGACIVTNDRYWDNVDKAGGGAMRREVLAWIRSHCISYTFVRDEFLPNPDFVFPPD